MWTHIRHSSISLLPLSTNMSNEIIDLTLSDSDSDEEASSIMLPPSSTILCIGMKRVIGAAGSDTERRDMARIKNLERKGYTVYTMSLPDGGRGGCRHFPCKVGTRGAKEICTTARHWTPSWRITGWKKSLFSNRFGRPKIQTKCLTTKTGMSWSGINTIPLWTENEFRLTFTSSVARLHPTTRWCGTIWTS